MPEVNEVDKEIEQLRSAQRPSADVDRTAEQLLALARTRPESLVPYVKDLAKLLDSAVGQVREGSLQSLNLLSRVAPGTMAFLLPRLHDLLADEPADVIKESAIEILTNYAKTGKHAAEKVVPILASTIDRYGTRNVVKVLNALTTVVQHVPKLGKDTLRIADRFQESVTDSVRSAAKKLGAVSRSFDRN